MEELEGANITKSIVEIPGIGSVKSYIISYPDGRMRSVPHDEGNADFQRLKLWNSANGNVLEIKE